MLGAAVELNQVPHALVADCPRATKEQKGPLSGTASWEHIKAVR